MFISPRNGKAQLYTSWQWMYSNPSSPLILGMDCVENCLPLLQCSVLAMGNMLVCSAVTYQWLLYSYLFHVAKQWIYVSCWSHPE
jgi:hypothetical protein